MAIMFSEHPRKQADMPTAADCEAVKRGVDKYLLHRMAERRYALEGDEVSKQSLYTQRLRLWVRNGKTVMEWR